jgi:hypothetical protein
MSAQKSMKPYGKMREPGVLYSIHSSGPFGTVPELLFEKKGLIPALQELLIKVC